MSKTNAEFLDVLRKVVTVDLEQEPKATELCEHEHKHAVDALTMALWAMGLRDGDPDALAVLSEPVGPLVPEYWADRLWPPPEPALVLGDYDAWQAGRDVLR